MGAVYQARVSVTEDLEAAIDLLESQQVDGVVYARLPLEYYLHQHPQVPYQLASFSLGPQPYGIALPLNSPLTQELNQYILQLPTQINMQRFARPGSNPSGKFRATAPTAIAAVREQYGVRKLLE